MLANDDFYKITELSQEYVQQTANLLNSEWPRSTFERINNLKKTLTTTELPKCLILIHKQDNQVIGHLKVSQIEITSHDSNTQINKKSFLIQSVIIHASHRKKGLGKLLMQNCEYLIKSLFDVNTQLLSIYLSTKDKQLFYESLGYKRIEPFVFHIIEPNNSRKNEIIKQLLASMHKNSNQEPVSTVTTSDENSTDNHTWYLKSID